MANTEQERQEKRRRERATAQERVDAEIAAEYERRSARAGEWATKYWGEKPHPCFVCGADDWMFLEIVDVTIPPLAGREPMVYSLLPVICRNCGYTVFANAIAAGVIEPEPDDGSDSEVSE